MADFWPICCASVKAQVALTYEAFHSFYGLLVCDYFWENCVLVHQFKGLCRHPRQAQCGRNAREQQERSVFTTKRRSMREKCGIMLLFGYNIYDKVFVPGNFRQGDQLPSLHCCTEAMCSHGFHGYNGHVSPVGTTQPLHHAIQQASASHRQHYRSWLLPQVLLQLLHQRRVAFPARANTTVLSVSYKFCRLICFSFSFKAIALPQMCYKMLIISQVVHDVSHLWPCLTLWQWRPMCKWTIWQPLEVSTVIRYRVSDITPCPAPATVLRWTWKTLRGKSGVTISHLHISKQFHFLQSRENSLSLITVPLNLLMTHRLLCKNFCTVHSNINSVTIPDRLRLTRWGDHRRVRWRSSRGCSPQAAVRIQCFHLEPEKDTTSFNLMN